MICWYCHWGWPKAVRDIWDRVVAEIDRVGVDGGESAMEYGPAHIVWCDENFEREHVEYCLKACDDETAHWKDLDPRTIEVVRRSLRELLALPVEVLECEPADYDGENVEDWPPREGMTMSREGREYVATGKPRQVLEMTS